MLARALGDLVKLEWIQFGLCHFRGLLWVVNAGVFGMR